MDYHATTTQYRYIILARLITLILSTSMLTSCILEHNDSQSPMGSDAVGSSDTESADSASNEPSSTDSATEGDTQIYEAWRAAKTLCTDQTLPVLPDSTPDGITGWNPMDHPFKDDLLLEIRDIKSDVTDLFFCGERVGEGGVLMRYDFTANSWTNLDTDVSVGLNYIWMNSGFEIVIVGDAGTILTYSNVNGTVKPFADNPFNYADGSGPDFFAAFGNNTEDFFVLGENAFYHYHRVPASHAMFDPESPDTPVWEAMTPPPVPPGEIASRLSYVFAPDTNEVFGTEGARILRWQDNTWEIMSREHFPNSLMRGLWGLSRNDIFVFGIGAEILHYDGVEWLPWKDGGLDSFSSIYSVWGTSQNNLFAGSDDGKVLHFNGEYWSTMQTPALGKAMAKVWGFGPEQTDVVASDGNNQIFRYEVHDRLVGESYTLLDSDDPQYLASIVADNQGNVFAAGVTSQGETGYLGIPVLYKLNANNNVEFKKTYPVTGVEWVSDITIHNGHVYMYSSVTAPGLETFSDILATASAKALRLRQFDMNGDMTGDVIDIEIENGDIYPEDLAVDANGSFVLTGIATGSFHGETNAGMIDAGSVGTVPAAYDAFVIKVSSDGTRKWTKIFGVPDVGKPQANRSGETISGLAIDASATIYVAGYANGDFIGAMPDLTHVSNEMAQQSSDGDINYLLKMSPDGEYLGGVTYPVDQFGYNPTLSTDDAGRLYMAGGARYADVDGQQCLGQCNFYQILNQELAPLGSRLFGSIDNQVIEKLAVLPTGEVFAAGSSDGAYGGRVHAGGYDVFVTQLSAAHVVLGTLMYGGESSDGVIDLTIGSDGSPVLLMSTTSRLNGQEPSNGNYGFGIWKPGLIPNDNVAECRNLPQLP